jgi:hypothetical protein
MAADEQEVRRDTFVRAPFSRFSFVLYNLIIRWSVGLARLVGVRIFFLCFYFVPLIAQWLHRWGERMIVRCVTSFFIFIIMGGPRESWSTSRFLLFFSCFPSPHQEFHTRPQTVLPSKPERPDEFFVPEFSVVDECIVFWRRSLDGSKQATGRRRMQRRRTITGADAEKQQGDPLVVFATDNNIGPGGL